MANGSDDILSKHDLKPLDDECLCIGKICCAQRIDCLFYSCFHYDFLLVTASVSVPKQPVCIFVAAAASKFNHVCIYVHFSEKIQPGRSTRHKC